MPTPQLKVRYISLSATLPACCSQLKTSALSDYKTRQWEPTRHNFPVEQAEPFGAGAEQSFVDSLHAPLQLELVLLTQGSPACLVHAPAVHLSVPLQYTPSLQLVPSALSARPHCPATQVAL